MKKKIIVLLLASSAIAVQWYVRADDEDVPAVAVVDQALTFDNDAMQQTLKQLEEKMHAAQEALTPEKRAELEKLEENAKELGIKLNDLHTALADFQAAKGVQKAEINELEERLAAILTEKAALPVLADDEEESPEAAATRAKLDADSAALEAEIAEKRAAKRETKEAIESHEAEVATTEEALSTVHNDMPPVSFGDGEEQIDFDTMFAGVPEVTDAE